MPALPATCAWYGIWLASFGTPSLKSTTRLMPSARRAPCTCCTPIARPDCRSVVPRATMAPTRRDRSARLASSITVDGASSSAVEWKTTIASRSPSLRPPITSRAARRASSIGLPSIDPEVSTTSARLTGGLSASGRTPPRIRTRAASPPGLSAATSRRAGVISISTSPGSRATATGAGPRSTSFTVAADPPQAPARRPARPMRTLRPVRVIPPYHARRGGSDLLHGRDHGVGEALRVGPAAQVSRAGVVVGQRAVDAGAQPVGRLPLAHVVEQHRRRQHEGARVGHPLAGDVRRGAVDRLEDGAAALAEVAGRRQPEPADQAGGQVAQDVAEKVHGDDHVELLRL